MIMIDVSRLSCFFRDKKKNNNLWTRGSLFSCVYTRVGFFLSQFRLFSFFIKEELLHSSNSLLSVLDLREFFHN